MVDITGLYIQKTVYLANMKHFFQLEKHSVLIHQNMKLKRLRLIQKANSITNYKLGYALKHFL